LIGLYFVGGHLASPRWSEAWRCCVAYLRRWASNFLRRSGRKVGRVIDGEYLSVYRATAHRQCRNKTVETLKAMQMKNCKFANVVVLSDEKLVAQLDCNDSTDGDKALLSQISKVEGVVQTNIIAVVRPVKH
jgi:hypothetical protein